MSRSQQWTSADSHGAPRKSGWKGLIIVLAIYGALVLLWLGARWLFRPEGLSVREAVRRANCKNNLKQISLALHNYDEMYGSFPPAYIADMNGKPMHRWRVLLLPYLDASHIYRQYKFDEPWDSPNNRRLAEQMPDVFRCPSSEAGSTMTNYMTVRGPKTVFPGDKAVRIRDIADGTSKTVAIVEVPGKTVHWLSPDDVSPEEFVKRLQDADSGEFQHEGGTHVAFCDTVVRFLTSTILRKTLKALLTRDGKEIVDDF